MKNYKKISLKELSTISEYKISIIIPVYNVETEIHKTIESILNQSIGFENLQVIMVDNCSSDNSREIIDEYANKYDNFISIHHQVGSGSAGKPRNTGLSHATGDYVMFLDSDDSYTPKACETLYNKINDIDGDIIFGRYERVYTYSGKVKKSYSPYKDNLTNLKENNPLNVPDFLWNIIKIFLYGKNIKIKHTDGTITVYAHCSEITQIEGSKVKQGDIIAQVGNTGYSTGTHLHFEIWKNEKALDPILYIDVPQDITNTQ